MIGKNMIGRFDQQDAFTDGLFFGNGHQFLVNALGAGATIVYAVVATLIIGKVLDWTMGLRVKEQEEAIGLDNTQHKESAYTLID